MTPQEHYEEAERLLRANYADADTHRAAQVHATLALAGFTRDAATGADHVHPVGSRDTIISGTVVDPFTGPGRPA